MLKVNHHKGRMLILGFSLVLVFALGLGTILAQSNSAGTASPTQQSQQISATALALFGLPTASSTPVPTATSMPTHTVSEAAQQKTQYINKLVATLGFSHPVFEDMANSLLHEELLANHYIEVGELELETRTTFFADAKYVVLIAHRAGFITEFDRLVLFRLVNQEPFLLDNPLTDPSDALHIGDDNRGFLDTNGNGLPDIVISTFAGGMCCVPRLNMLEIKPNNQIVDISPQPTEVYPAKFEDINHDGIPEIQALSPNTGLSMVDLVLWFGWNGQQYVDVSAQHPELYLPRIDAFRRVLTTATQCYLKNSDEFAMRNFLADNYALRRLPEGWSELQRLISLNCSTADLQTYSSAFTFVEHWVKYHTKS